MRCRHSSKGTSMTDKEAMKLALEALELERDKYLEWGDEDGAPENVYEAITYLRQAIEQADKQEPVAYDKTELNCFAQDLYDQKMREGKRGHYESMFHVIHQCVKKVATPPQRTEENA